MCCVYIIQLALLNGFFVPSQIMFDNATVTVLLLQYCHKAGDNWRKKGRGGGRRNLRCYSTECGLFFSCVMYETGAVCSHARSLWKMEHIHTKWALHTFNFSHFCSFAKKTSCVFKYRILTFERWVNLNFCKLWMTLWTCRNKYILNVRHHAQVMFKNVPSKMYRVVLKPILVYMKIQWKHQKSTS